MSPFRSLRSEYVLLSPAERRLWRHPAMWLSAAVISAVPLLYAVIALGATLDPHGRLSALPVALVNLDRGTTRQGKRYALGADVVRDLKTDPEFRYLNYASQDAAEDAVRRGKAYFALTIPASFSQQSLAGRSRDHGTLHFYVAEGSSYFAGRVAAAFATTLSDELNRTLGETRWEIVQRSLKEVDRGLADVRQVASDLVAGAAQLKGATRQLHSSSGTLADRARRAAVGSAALEQGAGRLESAVTRLTDSTGRLSNGLRQLDTAVPDRARLAPLQTGLNRLSVGAGALAGELGQLSADAGGLASSARTATRGAAGLAQGSERLAAQLPPLQRELGQLSAAAGRLQSGARAVDRVLRVDAGQAAPGSLGQLASSVAASAQAAAGNGQRLARDSGTLGRQLSQLQGGLEAARQGAVSATASVAGFALQSGQLSTSLKTQLLVPAQVREDVAGLHGDALQLQGGISTLNIGLPKFAAGARQGAALARQLQTGAAELASEAARLDTGARALTRALRASPPAAGTARLSDGAASLVSGLRAAQASSGAAVRGARELSGGAAQLSRSSGPLQAGGEALAGRASGAARAARSLQSEASTLQSGVNTLVDGAATLQESLEQITRRLPAPAELGALRSGANTLARQGGGLGRDLSILSDRADRFQRAAAAVNQEASGLVIGLRTLESKIPTGVEAVSRVPEDLSVSVRPEIQTFAGVKNNGAAVAPQVMALSLWVGVTLTTLVFPYSQLPRRGRHTSQLSRMARKAATPALLVGVQALLVVWGVQALGVEFRHPAQVLVTAVLSSLTFLGLVLALIFCLGATGRLLALILLVAQLAAVGGSYPVELAPPIVQTLHSWLPVTPSVNALRHALNGAFQGAYPGFMLMLLGTGALGVGVGLSGRRRWEFVDDEAFRPPISSPTASQELQRAGPEDTVRS